MSTNTITTKQFTETQAPEGYWVDAKGVLTPEHLIKDIDKARDQLVGECKMASESITVWHSNRS